MSLPIGAASTSSTNILVLRTLQHQYIVAISDGETTTKNSQDIVIMSYKMTVKLQAFAKRIECEAPQQSP